MTVETLRDKNTNSEDIGLQVKFKDKS